MRENFSKDNLCNVRINGKETYYNHSIKFSPVNEFSVWNDNECKKENMSLDEALDYCKAN